RARRSGRTPTWNGAVRWPSLIISISTCGIPSGDRRSSRPTPTPRGRFGSTSTGMSGLNGSVRRPALTTWRSTTGSDPVPRRPSCNEFATGWARGPVHTFVWRWCHRLPYPFIRSDLRHGYTYQLGFRQFEVSDTRVFDRPPADRAFFESL